MRMMDVRNRTYRIWLTIMVCVVACLGFADCEAVVSLGVSPQLIELSVPSGRVHEMDLKVYNQGDGRLSINAYVSSIELSLDGTPVPLETKEGERSCAEWITLDKHGFELLPGEEQAVHATIEVPRGSTGGRYAVILFEGIPALSDPEPWDMPLGTRVGSIVMESIPHTLLKDCEIESVEISKSVEEGVEFDVHFRNTGNVHIRARGSVVIKSGQGRIVDRVPLDVGTGTVLPDGVRSFRGTWFNPRRMEKGDYTGEVRMSCPGMGMALSAVDFSLE
jgi:hypothetical protein